jgi:phage terminase small subunit
MELKPSHEMFAQALIKHKGHQTNAYLEAYPGVKEASARTNASRLLANVSVRRYIAILLDSQGLGIKDILKRLKELSEATRTVQRHNIIFDEPIYGIQLQAIQTALRIYENIGYEINLTPEQMNQIAQMVKDFEKKQDDSGAI